MGNHESHAPARSLLAYACVFAGPLARIAFLGALIAALLIAAPLAADAATPSTYPDDGFITDGSVRAVTMDSAGRTYFGGTFQRIGRFTGSAVIRSSTFGDLPLHTQFDGPVTAAISDGQGGWFVGGSFTHANNLQVGCLAHLFADGTLDTEFGWGVDIAATTQASSVDALLLTSTGKLVIGGSFANIRRPDGTTVPSNNLAIIDLSQGLPAATLEDPPLASTPVTALAETSPGVTQSTIWFARRDDGISTESELVGWKPSTRTTLSSFGTVNGIVNALAVTSDGRLIVGGQFAVGQFANTGSTYSAMALSADGKTTGYGTWQANPLAQVAAIAVNPAAGGNVYLGGSGDVAGMKAVNTANGTAIATFVPPADPATGSITALGYIGGSLIVGRSEGTLGAPPRALMARLSPTGVPSAPPLMPERSLRVMSVSGGNILFGGDFAAASTLPRMNVARVANDAVDPTWRVAVNAPSGAGSPVTSMAALANGGIVIGGNLTSAGLVDLTSSSIVTSPLLATVGETPASGLITVDAAGTISGRHTTPASTTYRVDDLAAVNGTVLAVASSMTATAQTEVVTAFSETAAQVGTTYMSSTPKSGTTTMTTADAAPFSIAATPQANAGTSITLFVGGASRVWQRYSLATSLPVSGSPSTTSGLWKTTWSATGSFADQTAVSTLGDDRGDADALYLSPTDPTRLWVGGTYSRLNGVTATSRSSNLVAVSIADGSVSFPANWTHTYPNGPVRAITEAGGQLLVGGEFTNLTPAPPKAPKYLASYGASQGIWNVTTWAPRPISGVAALFTTPTDAVIAAGSFPATERRFTGGIASFAQPVVASQPTGLLQVNIADPAAPQTITTGATIASNSVNLTAALAASTDRRPQGLAFEITKDSAAFSTITRPGGWRPDSYGASPTPPTTIRLTNLPDGRYTWSVRAVSADGIFGPSATTAVASSPSFTVDRSLPVLTAGSTLLVGANGASPAWTGQVSVRAATFSDLTATTSTFCISASATSCTADATTPASGSYGAWTSSGASRVFAPSTQPTLTPGTMYYVCQQDVDAAGNRSLPICSPGFRWDPVPPSTLTVDPLGTTTSLTRSIPIAARDDESGIDRIVIERSTSPTFATGVVTLATLRPASLAPGEFAPTYQWSTAGLTGAQSIRVTAFDAAGNSLISAIQTTIIDQTAPAAPTMTVSMLPDPTWAYRASSTALIVHGCCSDSSTLRITATSPAPDDVSSVQFSMLDGTWPSTTPLPWSTASNRVYNYQLAAGVPVHGTVGVRVLDAAGNSSDATLAVHTDRFAPVSSLTVAPPRATNGNVSFTMAASDPPDQPYPQAGVDRIDTNVRPLAAGTADAPVWGLPLATNPVACSGTSTLRSCTIQNASQQSLPDGVYGLETIASDLVRNVEVPSTPTPFTIDHVSPDVSQRTLTLPTGTQGARLDMSANPPVLWIKPAASGTVSLTVTAAVHDTLGGIQNIRFAGTSTCTEFTALPAAPTVSDRTASCTMSLPRTAGPDQTYSIVATDRAGNIGPTIPADGQFVVRYDATGPTPPTFGAGQVTMLGSMAAFAGTFANDADIDDWKLELADPISGARTLLARDASVARPAWRATWDTTGIADGQYPIILTLLDKLGNSSSATYMFPINRSTVPATPDIQTAQPGSEGSATTLAVAWNPNADQDLTGITLQLRKRTGTLLDPPQTMAIPAGVARVRGTATSDMSAGTAQAAFTLIDDRRDIRLLPGATYEVRVRNTTANDNGQYSDPTVVSIPLANANLTTTQLATDDKPLGCGTSATKCHYAGGESARILGDIDLATFAVGRRINVSIYQMRNGSWQLDDTVNGIVNLTGDFLVKISPRAPGVYRADVLLPPGPLLQTGISTEYLVWGR